MRGDPTNWLLEEENPFVRHSAMVDLLEISHANPEVERARKAIMEKGVVPKILAKQKKRGYWEAAKQDGQGKWLLQTTFNGRVQVNIEQKSKPSEWITLDALNVLRRLRSQQMT